MTINGAFDRFIQNSWEDEIFLPLEEPDSNNPSLTITQAVQRTKIHVPYLDVCIEDVTKSLSDDKQCKLTLDECVALRLCTERVNEEGWCVRLNRALCSDDKKALNSWRPFLRLFYCATKKLPDYQGCCWRAGSSRIIKQIQKRQSITWPGISSCSIKCEFIERECLDKNGILFMIDVIDAKDISKYSMDAHAQEILLMPGTRLVVKNIERYKTDNTITLVHLQEQAIVDRETASAIEMKPELHYEQTLSVETVISSSSSRDKMLKRQAELKAYYDDYPDIDSTNNITNHDMIKAEEFTKSILNRKPSGNVTERDTACHILNKLLGNGDQQCLFYNSTNGISLHDASGNLVDIDTQEKPFVLKLNSSQGLGSDINTKTIENDMKLVEILESLIEQNKSHPIMDDVRDRLAKAHGVNKSSIVIKTVFLGTFNIVYTVLSLAQTAVTELWKTSQKLKSQFDQFLSAKIHPLLFRPSFDIAFFDARGNKTFSNRLNTYQIGPPAHTKTYTSAPGWTRYGLRVLGKSAYINDYWLHPFQHPGNCYRAYHGTGRAKPIDFGSSNVHSGKIVACVDALSSIFQGGFHTARIDVHGPGVYCSPNPIWLENSEYVGTVVLDTAQGKKMFKCMLQVAVNPDGVKCVANNIWVVPNSHDIRSYGILIKEV